MRSEHMTQMLQEIVRDCESCARTAPPPRHVSVSIPPEHGRFNEWVLIDIFSIGSRNDTESDSVSFRKHTESVSLLEIPKRSSTGSRDTRYTRYLVSLHTMLRAFR